MSDASHSEYAGPLANGSVLPTANPKLGSTTTSVSFLMPNVNSHVLQGSSERVQIINDDKNFTCSDLSTQIERWGLRDAGFNYNIVAVFGSQSTGKSTLLNRLFGTTFDVMDETKRQQTTKGIWMCRGKGMSVMVMDVEGTDGRERGEDQVRLIFTSPASCRLIALQDFERKSALFSLASSEVLIINLWEHQVGLYQGANMGLLKTVFEVNLGLFGKKSGLAEAQLSDYFDLMFTTLPHKILTGEKFEEEVARLRERFTIKGREDYVFKDVYHKRIPADGVAVYMENIWEQVQTNKDLDLPTQQELLAQFRCDEISTAALVEFNEQAKSQKRPIEAGRVVEGLGALMKNWRDQALARYDRDASRYHQGVYSRKRLDLHATIISTLSPLFLGQLKNLHKSCLSAFKSALHATLSGNGTDYNFGDVVGKATSECETRFQAGGKEACTEETEWSCEEELGLLREEIANVAEVFRKDETKKMVNLIERNFKRQISEPVDVALNKATPDMWDKVLGAFKQLLERAESSYLKKAKCKPPFPHLVAIFICCSVAFNCTEEENESALGSLRIRAWLALRAKIDELTADTAILGKLRMHFEERFRYDENGVPQVWKPDDDIEVLSAKQRTKYNTLALVPLFSKISPVDSSLQYTLPPSPVNATEEEFDFASSLVIFSESKYLDLVARFRRDADAYFVEAKRSTVSSIAQVPYWIYGVMLVLGWNEAMMVVFNPLYFVMVITMATMAWAILKLGLTGPLLQLSKTVASEIQQQAMNRLREHFSEAAAEQPNVLAKPTRASPLQATNSTSTDRVDVDRDEDGFEMIGVL
ncbi:protein SEY1 [Boletus reticuloceps]|uniref:Protein SEY1 n=1 Tax=Boletus reticuloceps TaxID=495285 RepID=A0A8I2YMS2_9AGAM|nr:protein SEY1 [Boletus reticuloceps]